MQPKVNSGSLKLAAWTQCESKFDLTFAITASLALAAMRDSLSDGRNDYKSWRQKCAVYTLLRSITVCSRANQTATSAQPLEQHEQTQQWLQDDLLKDWAPFSGAGGGKDKAEKSLYLSVPSTQWDFSYAFDSRRRHLLSHLLISFPSHSAYVFSPLGRQKEKPLSACQRSQ